MSRQAHAGDVRDDASGDGHDLAGTALARSDWLELDATVTDVKDGNTLRVVDGKGTVHFVRLSGSDAPELNQAGGFEARQRLKELVHRKTVHIVHRYFDTVGRILGKVYLDKTWINKQLIEEGHAWYYDPDQDAPELKDVAAPARAKRLGLWHASQPIPPWHWRRGVRTPREGLETEMPPEFRRAPSTNDRALIGAP